MAPEDEAVSIASWSRRFRTAHTEGVEASKTEVDQSRPFQDSLHVFWVHRLQILASAVLVGCIALVIAALLPDRFTAVTLLLLEPRNEQSAPIIPSATAADSEVEILKSDSLAAKVSEKLDLKSDPEFSPEEGKLSRLRRELFSSLRAGLSGRHAPAQRAAGEDGSAPEAVILDAATRTLQKIVTIRRRGLTDVIAIEAVWNSPSRAAQIANTFASVYLQEQVDAKAARLDQAEAATASRVKAYNEQLSASEAQIGVRDLYRDSLAKLTELSQQRSLLGPNARVVSRALVPEVASFPPRLAIVVLGFLLGLGTAWGTAYLRFRQVERRPISHADVRRGP
ncbi:Wzz/FepE/Etk N-terminal domain-containing protein [Alsobacter sp. SYSU BS001988]